MNYETGSALYQAEQIFSRYEAACDFAKRSGAWRSMPDLTRGAWIKMENEFDMRVQLHNGPIFRYFLPRLLEWFFEIYASESHFGWPESWDISGPLNHMNWLAWPTDEVEALRSVFEAWVQEELAKYEGEMPIDFLSTIESDLARYLNIWLQVRPHEIAEWLWTLDWKHHENAMRWAIEPHVEAALEAAFFADPDRRHAQSLSRAIDLVCSLRG